jgi:hypothetical protein
MRSSWVKNIIQIRVIFPTVSELLVFEMQRMRAAGMILTQHFLTAGLLREHSLRTLLQMYYQYDGANQIPLRTSRSIWKNNSLAVRRYVKLATGSTDLSPLSYHVWDTWNLGVWMWGGHNRWTTQRIYDASGYVNNDIVLRNARSVLKRTILCTQVNGGLFEQLLRKLNNVNLLSLSQ